MQWISIVSLGGRRRGLNLYLTSTFAQRKVFTSRYISCKMSRNTTCSEFWTNMANLRGLNEPVLDTLMSCSPTVFCRRRSVQRILISHIMQCEIRVVEEDITSHICSALILLHPSFSALYQFVFLHVTSKREVVTGDSSACLSRTWWR